MKKILFLNFILSVSFLKAQTDGELLLTLANYKKIRDSISIIDENRVVCLGINDSIQLKSINFTIDGVNYKKAVNNWSNSKCDFSLLIVEANDFYLVLPEMLEDFNERSVSITILNKKFIPITEINIENGNIKGVVYYELSKSNSFFLHSFIISSKKEHTLVDFLSDNSNLTNIPKAFDKYDFRNFLSVRVNSEQIIKRFWSYKL